MLEKFSSENSLQEAIKKAEIEKEQKALEEAYEKEQILKAKKAKIKKILITSAITLASLIILFVAGFFIRNLCYNMIAKSARDNGDYAKAYSLYAKTGSSKIGEITKAVQGNTPSNLVSGGISTEDKDNLYFLAYDSTTGGYNLIKENKASKERLTLTDDTLGELNVSGDYIYYLNSEKKVWRTRKDGTSSELVVDKEAFLMTVIGNDIFYITTEFDNPNNLSYEQCQLLAAQGQMDAFYRIRKFNIDSKKDTMISEDNVSSFSVYKDKIYFLTMGEDTTKSSFLKSMSLDGKNVENVIDVPVYRYLIHGDEIYYIKIFTGDPASGNISYSLAKKNLKTGKNEDLYPGTAIFDLNATEDNLLYISVNYQDYMNSYSNPDAEPATISLMSLDFKTNSEKVLVSGNLRYFNISGDSIFLVTDEGIFRLNVDGTGFAPIYGDGSSVSTVEEQEVSEENQ